MKLEQVRIKNFRCYREEFVVNLDALTCLIARNDAGKSSVLEAIDAFFNLEKLDAEDRSIGLANSVPVEVTCVFSDVQPHLVIDTDATIQPLNEHLLNQDGRLEVTKRFSGATPKCEEIYVHALHPTTNKFNDLFSLSIAQLKPGQERLILIWQRLI